MNEARIEETGDGDPMGPEVTALVRGELSPAEEGPVRAHLASCAACSALAADLGRIRAAAAARTAPVPDAAARARVATALDVAWEEAEAAECARGPVARILDIAGRRYAESRRFRFLVYSLGAHAAAAVFLSVWLSVDRGARPAGTEDGERQPIEIARTDPLPPVEPYDPLEAPPTPPPARAGGSRLVVDGAADVNWMGGGAAASGGPASTRFDDSPADLAAALPHQGLLYPCEEMRAFSAPRFRRELREKRLSLAYGPVEGARAALSVERGARWLAMAQQADGTWESGRPGDPRVQRDRFRGGVTGMSLLALLGDGRTAMRPGPFARSVRTGVEALVRSQDPASGLLGTFARGPADDRPLCNHGPALSALAEEYGVDYGLLPAGTRDQLRAVVAKAVKATLDAQLPDGSFGYARGARQGDASVTLLQVEALQAARRAGFEVDVDALRRAGRWLAGRLGPDGRLGYREAGDRAADATLTAEALSFATDLGLDRDARDRMLRVVLAEARAGNLEDRVLFRTALLEALARTGDPEARALAPDVARASIDAQGAPGTVPSGRDRYAAAGGDSLATARTLRALTAPYRAGW